MICLGVVGVVVLWAIEPRFHQSFPSMIDDWQAIKTAPENLRDILRLGIPEGQRYRPGFIAWSALQWHTLGAPDELRRAAVLGHGAAGDPRTGRHACSGCS